MKHPIVPFLCALMAMCLHGADQPAAKTLPMAGEVFAIEGHATFIIPAAKPAAAGEKTPWVWYAPTLPGLPAKEEQWMFERFAAAGIAIVGIDVGESSGSPDGRKLYSALYDELTSKRGFAAKPVLLGRSRGGLMLLNWAAENADKTAAFAGVYPVCNITSYPGIDKAAPAYHLKTADLTEKLAEHNPVDRLDSLIKENVPFFAIHGDNDKVVPLEKNSGLVAERYRAAGKTPILIVPKGQGHNMWTGFFQSQELVDFVIKNAKP